MSVLHVDRRDAVAVLTLNRPAVRNALSGELLGALAEAVTAADADAGVHAVVLTGADPAFCAGLDLAALAAGPSEGRGDAATAIVAGDVPLGLLPPHRTPVIGAVNGAAVTGGLELALGCDFLVASTRARFADTHARVGVMPGAGLTLLLPEAVGLRRARQMSFTGDYVDAATALDWGLVNEVVPHEQLLERAIELATTIASLPPDHVAELRAMYDDVDPHRTPARRAVEATRAQAWMRTRFDRTRLAAERAAIEARGRAQVQPPSTPDANA